MTILLVVGAAPAPTVPPPPRSIVSRLTIRERIILRVPARHGAPLARTTWHEKKGPRCMALTGIDGAAVVDATTVDFILDGGTRLRARFEARCPALDFYSGFYLAPTADGRICAGRDELRDRTGNSCGIDRFRTLVADPPVPSKAIQTAVPRR